MKESTKQISRKKAENGLPPAPVSELVQQAPSTPGCYLWKSTYNEILYIGKARNLKARLQSYLRKDKDIKTFFMVQEAASVEWITTTNAVEALLLEATLIKKHAPRYNVRLKDDKRYPYICVSTAEPFPMVYMTRKIIPGKNRYFGPYTEVRRARSMLALIHKIFPVRKTPLKLPLKKPARPCMNFHIKRCLGPCQGNVLEEDYGDLVQKILFFLEGRREILETLIASRIQALSAELQFERAALYRDMLYNLKQAQEEQHVMHNSAYDQDILALARHDLEGQLVIIEIREGRMIGRKSYPVSLQEKSTEKEIYAAAIRDIYSEILRPPPSLLIPVRLSEEGDLEEFLANRFGYKSKLRRLKTGEDRHLFRIAQENADSLLKERIQTTRYRDRKQALRELKSLLKLKSEPEIMECYDVSHLSGTGTVASGVRFESGIPRRSEYRRYRIRHDQGNNDPLSMREVIGRRLERLTLEKKRLPDLIVIDGGSAQLQAALQAARKLGLALPFIGLAKKEEDIYLPEQHEPLTTDKNSAALRLLRQMRDEAHRFAVDYQRTIRNQSMLGHSLQAVKGIGRERMKSLLKFFQGRDLSHLSAAELARAPGVGPALAKQIHAGLRASLTAKAAKAVKKEE